MFPNEQRFDRHSDEGSTPQSPLCLGGSPVPAPPSLVKTPCPATRSKDPEEAEEELLQVRGGQRCRRPLNKGQRMRLCVEGGAASEEWAGFIMQPESPPPSTCVSVTEQDTARVGQPHPPTSLWGTLLMPPGQGQRPPISLSERWSWFGEMW